MCGRYAQRTDPKRLAKELKVAEVPEVKPRYNIAPTQEVLAVRGSADDREATFFRWGLVPSWAKDSSMGAKLINARSETVEEKPSFRDAFRRRRCVIPADGFYEWARDGRGKKQPYYFRMRDDRPFGFAGLWERWEREGQVINSCAILTTEANEVLRPVHDRMPVILHPHDYALWLEGGEREQALLRELLRPYPAGEMVTHPVSALVNSPSNNGAELIEEMRLNSA
jgi:putative SOS response-associated peptidase YedK